MFVMPSRREALCRALLEAMSQGVCPIVSDAGGMKEVVRHGRDGLVVPREDAEALAAAIRALYEDRSRLEAYAASAQRRCTEEFCPKKMAERTLKLYHRVVDRRAASAA